MELRYIVTALDMKVFDIDYCYAFKKHTRLDSDYFSRKFESRHRPASLTRSIQTHLPNYCLESNIIAQPVETLVSTYKY